MADLIVDPSLIGAVVRNPARPEWGDGRVADVRPTGAGASWRVTVQFHSGRKVLIAPPARLIAPPTGEVRRDAGWIDQLAGNTLEERLQRLPEDVLTAFGTPSQRLDAILPWYAFSESAADLLRWARKLTGIPDPLTQWSRDELARAFGLFCQERDSHLRSLAALLKKAGGSEALIAWRGTIPEPLAGEVSAALGRVL